MAFINILQRTEYPKIQISLFARKKIQHSQTLVRNMLALLFDCMYSSAKQLSQQMIFILIIEDK